MLNTRCIVKLNLFRSSLSLEKCLSMNRLLTFLLIAGCCIIFYPSLSQDLVEEKIVYAQPFKLKSSGISENYASAFIEDSISKTKVAMVRADRKAVFSLIDADWKLLQSFETVLDKKSCFLGIYPKIASFSVKDNIWTMIVEGSAGFSVEKIDFAGKTHEFSAKIFDDRDKDYKNKTFKLKGSTYNMYLTKKGEMNMAVIDAGGNINTYALDVSTQVNIGKKDFKTNVLFDNLGRMGAGLVDLPELTYKKFHYYTGYQQFVISAVYEKPFAEVMYYDWNTGKKLKSDIFSIEDLLPAAEKNSSTNTTALLHDEKVFVLSAYKNGGVLGVFDRSSKKMIYHFTYNDQTPKDVFSYGPVFYKAVPGTVSGYKEKLDEVTMDEFSKDAFKRNTALTVHWLNAAEYVVSLGSYDEIKLLNDRTGRFSRIGPSLTGGFPERMAAGLIFQQDGFKAINKKTSFNELNKVDLSNKYEKAKKPVVKATDPEYAQKKAIFLQSQDSNKRSLTMYLFEGQFKILESVYE